MTKHNPDVSLKHQHSTARFAMRLVPDSTDNYTSNDLTMVKRGNVFEVWTARDFPANTLILAPECLEIKDKYWTQGRSAMTRNGSSHHPENKQIVLDGRLRSSPSEVRPCSVFFVVSRSMQTEECNLNMDYTSLEISAKVLGTKRKLMYSLNCLHTQTHPEIKPACGSQSYGISRCA